MKCILCNTNGKYYDYDVKSKLYVKFYLDEEYYRKIKDILPIKRVKQLHFDCVITIKDMLDIQALITILDKEIIINNEPEAFKKFGMPIIEIYDDWRE